MRGYIRKRGKDSWQIIFDLARGVDGKRRQARHTVRGTKRDAEARLRELITSLDKGDYVPPCKETVSWFLQRWLDSYVATNTSLRTQEGYRERVRRYLIPALGPLAMTALRPEHVQALYADMLGRGLSARTVLGSHRVLRAALSHAVRWRLVARNITDVVDPPRPRPKEMVALSSEGVVRLLATARESPYRDVFLVALYTGLRRSEALALRWSEVDLDKGSIRVVAGLHRLPGMGLVLLPTKTARSRRQVAVTHEVIDVLRQIKGYQLVQRLQLDPACQDTDFVFTKPDGSPVDPEKVTKAFAAIVKVAGLGSFRLHDLRHTHAFLMLQAGVHPKVVSERLGHASVTITMDTYSHVLPGIQEEAADRLSQLLAPHN